MRDHPLMDTHGVHWSSRVQIPNFIKETLPRCDQGDQEFYLFIVLLCSHCSAHGEAD